MYIEERKKGKALTGIRLRKLRAEIATASQGAQFQLSTCVSFWHPRTVFRRHTLPTARPLPMIISL